MSDLVASISNTSRVFNLNVYSCSPSAGRGVLGISTSALDRCNAMDRFATGRVTRGMGGLDGTSVNISIANITKPGVSRGGPIKLIFVTLDNGAAAMGRLGVRGLKHSCVEGATTSRVFGLVVGCLRKGCTLWFGG